jgi:hypothetical protein
MGVIITDLANKQHTMSLSWWAWSPLLGLILKSNVVTDEELLTIIEVTDLLDADPAEAKLLAEYLEKHILAQMNFDERLLHDGTPSSERDDGHLYRNPDEASKNYSVGYDTLKNFIKFCKECQGFTVN